MQRREHLVLGTSPQHQQGERIGVECVGDQVADGRGVLAGLSLVRAGTIDAELTGARKQLRPDAGREFAVEQRGEMADLCGHAVEETRPYVLVKHRQIDDH